jgi:hypothetical protein
MSPERAGLARRLRRHTRDMTTIDAMRPGA